MAGRPTTYKDSYCRELIDFMSKGYSYRAFAGEIGVHFDTLYTWERRYPEFSDAKKRGWVACLYYWEKLGIEGIKGSNGRLNSRLWIINMRNRFGWR